MGLVDELNSDANQWNRIPTPLINSTGLVVIGLLFGLAGLAYGGQGFLIALLAQTAIGKVTGAFYAGSKHQTQ